MYHYAYIMIDIFSRYAYCLLVKSSKPKEFISKWEGTFGTIPADQICNVLYSDNGNEFTANVTRRFFRGLGISQLFKRVFFFIRYIVF